MKKCLIVLLTATFFATSAMATSISPLTGANAPGFNPTKSVTVAYSSAATGGASLPNVFSMGSAHAAGDRQFNTTSVYGGLTFVAITPGTTPTAPSTPASPTDSSAPTGTPL